MTTVSRGADEPSLRSPGSRRSPTRVTVLTRSASSVSAARSSGPPGMPDPPFDVRRGDPPLGDESIRGEAGPERAAGILAVDVLFVLLDEDAEPGEVEVGVDRLQRIVSPLDQVEAHVQDAAALLELQHPADASAPERRQDAQHVRPVREAAAPDRGQRVDHPHESAGRIERADEDRAPPTVGASSVSGTASSPSASLQTSFSSATVRLKSSSVVRSRMRTEAASIVAVAVSNAHVQWGQV